MPNPYFRFKQFTVYHDRCAMKVTTDGCLFGAWCAAQLENTAGNKALDIGAGTGLLSLMVAQKTGLEIDAVELDADAASQATENVAASPWKERIKVHHSGIQDFSPVAPYPIIFSNPPFYENEWEPDAAGRNMAHHSGGLTLSHLVQQLNRLLAPTGTAFLLLPHKREKEIRKVLAAGGLYIHQMVTVHPSEVHQPFRLLLSLKKEKAENVEHQTLYVKENGNEYTKAFTALLKDYYLYL